MNTVEKHFSKPGGIREMLSIAFPMVVSSACETLMTFTDHLFLSKLGSEHMSAAMGGGMTWFMMMTFFIGLTGYSTALTAQYLGAGRKNLCPLVTMQTFIIALLAYPVILAGRPLAYRLFVFSNIAPEQLVLQKAYFNILIYAAIIELFRNGLSCFFSGVGRTRIVMLSAIIAMVVNITVNYILIFGRWGFPMLGIEGAAYGTIIGGFCALLVLQAAYFSKPNREEFGILNSFGFNKEIMIKLLRFGYPAGLEFFLNYMAFTGIIMVFHSRGLVTAVAATIVFNWDMVSFVPLIGIEIGVTSLVGRYMGAGRPDIAHHSAMSGLKTGWIYSTIILFLFVFFPEQLVKLFSPDGSKVIFDQAAPTAVTMIRLASVYVMIEALVVVFSGALRGAGDTFWTMCISVGLHWFLLPILILMLNVLNYSAVTAWMIMILAFMIFSFLFYLRYRSGKWRKLKIVADTDGAGF
ncbi:MAG: MATE family efflux transporter [Desulfobacterales bacterium]|nr:MATE family efflux transporter [Desulfobacterales bacterium]